MTVGRDAAPSANDNPHCVHRCGPRSPAYRHRMKVPRPGRGRRFRQLRHPGSWDLRFVGSGPISLAFDPPLLRNCYYEIGPVSRTDEAVGNLVEPVLRRALALAKLRRAFAGDIAEDPAERSKAVPSGLECDVDDRKVGVAQQGL